MLSGRTDGEQSCRINRRSSAPTEAQRSDAPASQWAMDLAKWGRFMSLMRITAVCIFSCSVLSWLPIARAQDVPKDIAGSVAGMLSFEEDSFYSVAEAMPEEKYAFVPTAG